MAANYWASTQHLFWENTIKDKSNQGDASDLAAKFRLPDSRLVNIYLQQQITKLAKRFPNSPRQIVLATAFIFVRRLYQKVDIRETNPYLVLATAFYLACKIEECPQHIKLVASEARALWPDFIQSDVSKVGECEFFLISKIHAQLIVHHPYRSLGDLQKMLSLTQDEMTLAWSVINDQYVTDAPLVYPPHIIATAAVTVMLVFLRGTSQGTTSNTQQSQQESVNKLSQAMNKDSASSAVDSVVTATTNSRSRAQKLTAWLSQSNIDVEAVIDCTQQFVSLYVLWDQYNEKDCKDKIAHFIKAGGLDR